MLLVETWETPEDQQIHCETEIFAKLQALKAVYCDNAIVERFTY